MTGREGPVNPRNFVDLKRHLVDGPTLDLGAGVHHPHAEGDHDVTVDADPACDPDVLMEIGDRLPFLDDEFDNVTAVHFLEHLPGDRDVVIWEEMQRVAAERAVAIVPIGRRDDPDHDHVYGRDEAIERFDADGFDVSSDPMGKHDLVLVAGTD